MRPYVDLTENGKIRRLRDLAEEALGQYDLDVKRVTCVARQRSTVFRVDTVDRQRFSLRVGARPSRTSVDTATEVAWLDALAKDSAPSTIRPIRNRKKELVTSAGLEGVPERRKCVLFDWIPGQPIGERAGPVDFGMLGEASAQLHERAERWRPGRRRLRPLVWNQVFYYPDEAAVLYDGRFRSVMTSERVEIIRELEARAGTELARLHDEVPLMMLHGGLHPWSIHLHGGRLHVLGFEDVMFGAPVQDLAITLFHSRDLDNFQDLLAAFVEGYRSIREWPVEYEGQVRLLMAARSLMMINYLLRMGFDAEQYIAATVTHLAEVLE